MITLTINGQTHRTEADPQMPLLWFLRDFLELTGTKYGCGKGLCGACTVLVNGQALRACLTPLSVVDKQLITTIEGLAGATTFHPVQQAWLDERVPQCGYCQAGQILSATALLNHNPEPSDEDIDLAMSGNLCRCGTYPRIKQAIHVAAKLAKEVKG